MRKRLLIILLAAVCAAGARAEFRWGATVGANVSNYYFKQNILGTSQTVGPNVGIMGEMMFPGIGFGVDFGLRYMMHGAKIAFGDHNVWSSDNYGTETSYLHSLQIPVSLRFKYTNLYGVERKVAPFAYAGPVFSFTVGHNKCEPLEYSTGCVGVQVGVGGEFWEKLQISAGYYWSLTYQVRTVKLDNLSGRTQGWQINAAWMF